MEDRLNAFLESLGSYSDKDKERVSKALEWGQSLHEGQKRASGEPYFIHPVQTAEILVELRMDADTIIAGILHDVLEDTSASLEDLSSAFGPDVSSMVDGVTKIELLKAKNKTVQEAETIRKMLFAMTKDIRVIMIKLADKLNNMRTLQHLSPDRQKAIATEVLDIYAPLADRLGISRVRDELEDLSLKFLNHDVYEQIKSIVAAKKGERAEFLKKVREALYKAALKQGLQVTIESRAKHFYSIYQKMRKRNKSADELYDLLGLRIICADQNSCYTMLGIVHQLWKPLEGRFKDYIAMPKANGYQSLHTTVMGYEGRLLEIQIRTKDMHQIAENGVASHWLYKQGRVSTIPKPKDLPIIDRLKNWEGIDYQSGEFLDEIKRELLKDSIYVFTPKGDAIELPSGATAVDFAYHIHTDIGNHCMAAKADGSIIPLTAELSNTQVIEILTSNQAHPHLNWLRAVRTAKARAKIRQWLEAHDDTLIISKNIVAKKRVAEPGRSPSEHRAPRQKREEGKGPITELSLASTVDGLIDSSRVGIKSGDTRNMIIRLAGCCRPTTGDLIIGYVSRGRGIIVHRRDCGNVKHIPDFTQRSIEVEWETASPNVIRRYRVTAKRSFDLFSEIEGAIRKQGGHLIEGKLEESSNATIVGYFTVEIEAREDAKRIVRNIQGVPSVINIQTIS